MRLLYLIALILFSPVFCFGQTALDSTKVRRPVLALFAAFPRSNNDSLTDYCSFPSPGYKKIKKIRSPELMELTSHSLASVRIYASEILARRKNGWSFEILKAHENDTTEWFNMPVECGLASMTFVDYYLILSVNAPLTEDQKIWISDLKMKRRQARIRFETLKWEKKYGSFNNGPGI